MERTIVIQEILGSKTADDDQKGKIIFDAIKKIANESVLDRIILDFKGIELINTAFLNDAIGKLYDRGQFDLIRHPVLIINMDPAAKDLVKESIIVAREKFAIKA